MRFTTCDPKRLVPYHLCDARRLAPYPTETCHLGGSSQIAGDGRIPRIPVIEIPPQLRLSCGILVSDLGDFLLYNGHHRRMAALCAGVREVNIAILETDADLRLHQGTEKLRLTPHSMSIIDHRKWVYKMVVDGTLEAVFAEHGVPSEPPLFRRR